ncbi:hypothetical protein ACLQ2E_21695 [Streptomyces lavendulocolor]
MTHSPTPAERLAIRTGYAALLNSSSPTSSIVEQIVFALGSAGLLMDPETAEELRRLRAAAGDGSTRTVDEDPIAYALTDRAPLPADMTHTCGIPLTRRLDCGHCPHEVCQDCDRCPCSCCCAARSAGLHHDYRLPHDLPALPGDAAQAAAEMLADRLPAKGAS